MKTYNLDNRNLNQIDLHCELLEQRMMLSTVTIFAAGATGNESLDLIVDGEVAYTYENVGGDIDSRTFDVYRFDANNEFSVDDIQLRFTNDLYDPEKGIDRNIVVDKIIVDGVTYETEDPSTFADAWWGDGRFQRNGNFETERMNVNSTFSFSSDRTPEFGSQGTRVRIEASGDTGEERFTLWLAGQRVKGFDAGTDEMSFFYQTDEAVDVSDVKIAFVNDLYDPDKGIDRNLNVRQIQLIDIATGERTTYKTNSENVLSTGTWLPGDGITRGFGRGDTLNSKGFFQYGQNDSAIGGRSLDAVLAQFERQYDDIVNPVFQDGSYVDNQGREYLVAGSRGGAQQVLVVRLLSDGTVDSGFGNNGLSVIPLERIVADDGSIGEGLFEATKLAFDSQDRVWAVSRVAETTSAPRTFRTQWFGTQISRLNSNGQLDISLGNDGTVVVPFEEGVSTNVRSIAINSNDRLLVTGNKVERFTSVILGVSNGTADGLTTLRFVEAGGNYGLVEV